MKIVLSNLLFTIDMWEMFSRIGASGFEEFTDFKPSFQLIPKKTGDGLKRRDARDGMEGRDVKIFEFGKKFKIGNLEILPCRVDHSLPGATGYIIYTSEGPLIYTGDLRFHGRHKEWSYEFGEWSLLPDIRSSYQSTF